MDSNERYLSRSRMNTRVEYDSTKTDLIRDMEYLISNLEVAKAELERDKITNGMGVIQARGSELDVKMGKLDVLQRTMKMLGIEVVLD